MKEFLLGGLFVIVVLFLLNVVIFWDYYKTKWHDFFYGLFTWQEKVAVYNIRSNSLFGEFLDRLFTDHYEWKKRKPFFEYIRCKIHKEKPYID